MTISVIIPTLNAERYIRSLVMALKSQSTEPDEILVIDSESNDQTCSIAIELGCKIISIKRNEFNHGSTRNRAAKIARGEILVFMTQDAKPENTEFLVNLTHPIRQKIAAATYARQIAYLDAYPTEVFARNYNYPAVSFQKSGEDVGQQGIKAYFFSNVSSAVSRQHFWDVGAFPENVIINEDMLLAARLYHSKLSIRYVAESVVRHSHNYHFFQQFSRYFDMGVFISRCAGDMQGAKAGGAGLKFVFNQMKYLLQKGQWFWLPRAFGEAASKFAGFQMGKWERFLPVALKKRFSMHSFYWDTTH
jgi:rhamnosyltransferase